MLDFIHIGFSKCASTYLQEVFRNTEGINFIYKSRRFSLLLDKEDDRNNEIIRDRINLESNEHIILPSFHPELQVRATCLEDVEIIIDKLYKHSPNAKIILVIRNQISLLKSRYSQYIVGGGGKLNINQFSQLINGNFEDDKDYYQNYYFRIIKMLENKFGKENLLVLLFEDFRKDSNIILEQLKTFTKIDFKDRKPNLLSMRKGISKEGLQKLRVFNEKVVLKKQDMFKRKELKIPHSIYTLIVRLFRVYDYYLGSEKIEIDNDIKEKLINKFTEDNKLLAIYLNRDLDELGYN